MRRSPLNPAQEMPGRPAGEVSSQPLGGITDEYMREMLAKTVSFTVVVLHKTPKRGEPGADGVVWEHGRRNFELRRDGKLLIVCPVSDGTDVSGFSIFSTGLDETKRIMEADPAVRAGIFTVEMHATRSFPGDSLTTDH